MSVRELLWISRELHTISKNSPRATLTFGASVVCTIAISAGIIQLTTPAALIAPRICAGNNTRPRMGGSVPVITMPSVTAGLKRPPLMR